MRSGRLRTILFLCTALVIVVIVHSCTDVTIPGSNELDYELVDAIKAKSPDGTLEFYVLPDENDLANIPQDPKNPLSPVKVELGKQLFYDTGIAVDAVKSSGMGTYSCATCHIPEAGFRPGTFQGVADGGIGFGIKGENRLRSQDYEEADLDVQSARALSLLNVAFVKNTFWNGQFGANDANEGTEHLWDEDTHVNELGFAAIESQNMEGVVAHRMDMTPDMAQEFGYKDMFDEAFPEIIEENRYTQFTLSLALSAYIRTLMSNEAPFQVWLRGDHDAISYEEKKGALLFFSKANCADCHYNENLGSNEFHALGVLDMDQRPSFNAFPEDKRNLGRGAFTKDPYDNYKFKVPQIYNMKDTPFYFHGSSIESITDLVEYFNDGIPENPRVNEENISNKFKPLNLTVEEKHHLIKFLEYSLNDPELERYAPEEVGSGQCFPNADEQSLIDLGCF